MFIADKDGMRVYRVMEPIQRDETRRRADAMAYGDMIVWNVMVVFDASCSRAVPYAWQLWLGGPKEVYDKAFRSVDALYVGRLYDQVVNLCKEAREVWSKPT